jgi:flagellar hook protein FlgE
MFETIFIGTSGLLNHAKGLRVVGNNLANVNTPGFKSAQLQFAELVDQGRAHSDSNSATTSGQGTGMTSLGPKINFSAGLDQGTGNPLDLLIKGNGFYAIERDGKLLYTRSGDFRFDDKGVLVNSTGDHVKGLDSSGALTDVTVETLGRSMPKATATVKFQGNITSTVATPAVNASISAVTVYDTNGVNNPLSLTFVNNTGGDYTVTVKDAAGTVLTTQHLIFSAGFPTTASSVLSFTLTPAGAAAQTVKLDFSANVTSLVEATSVAVASQDGYAAGVRTDQSIDDKGLLTVHYSNGQTATGARLALADFESDTALDQVGGSAFAAKDGAVVRYGYAGTDSFGTLEAGHREGSNVDLAEEFGNLILMQRGYQASSHVISTANDMIQELFDMKGHR